MKLKIYFNDNTLDIDIKDNYTEQMIIEALENSNILALTKTDDKAIIINAMNVIAIEIVK